MFITFEGPDGSGKTTAVNSIAEFLKSEGIEFLLTREPGSKHSKASRKIRKIIIDPENNISDMAEALLFAADRRMHLDNIINPALDEGKIVLCDRYIDSSLAYQGVGRGLGIKEIKKINDIATENKYPDLTIFFDISLDDSEKRVDQRAPKDRLELAGRDFHQRVYDGYQEVIKMFPKRIKVIDASKSKEEVFEQAKKIIVDFIRTK
ncbi:MAG: dTMP kinase [Mycoplasmataceae bacterium]|nr:dTMP kinase [Mycoplasmataceae bacterium]